MGPPGNGAPAVREPLPRALRSSATTALRRCIAPWLRPIADRDRARLHHGQSAAPNHVCYLGEADSKRKLLGQLAASSLLRRIEQFKEHRRERFLTGGELEVTYFREQQPAGLWLRL